MIARPKRFVLVFAALAAVMTVMFVRLPTAFLPDEDQGSLFTMLNAPVGATRSARWKW
jgi:multidrug efflux pump